ncbi:hypothetical protein [Clostridium sp. LIBA-8841]|uniref:hypothetical protein n=1 Tax=Clostridium sp. LIBA-8841 TaxID=2987530 RepID=UPI002AC7A5F3|nr:hypothetical protein [Clostridium sp. LIBA-8841]MDZ5253714.1 hypothetical protein [Clostridium sp. LIBA-8841]
MSEKIIGKNSTTILNKLKTSIIIFFISVCCMLGGSFSQTTSEIGFYISWLVLILGVIGLFISSILFMVSIYKALKFILTSLDILLENKK